MELQLIIAVIVCAVGIAFVFQAIPPNRWFGVRTARTTSDPATWYRAHRAFGLILLVLGLVIISVLILWPTTPAHPASGLVGVLLVVAAAVFVYRRYAA